MGDFLVLLALCGFVVLLLFKAIDWMVENHEKVDRFLGRHVTWRNTIKALLAVLILGLLLR